MWPLNSDLEPVFAPVVISLFVLDFVFILYFLKLKIDEQLRRSDDRIKESKVRIQITQSQELLIWRKVLSEIKDRHQHSIVGSYLKQSFNERLQRVQHNPGPKRLVQKLPNQLPNQEKTFLPETGLSVLSYGLNEGNSSVTLKKKKSKKGLKVSHTKIYETRRVGPRASYKEPETENSEGKRQTTKQKWDTKNLAGSEVKSPCLIKRNKKLSCQKNFIKYNINKTRSKNKIGKERPTSKYGVNQKQNNSNKNKQENSLNNVKPYWPRNVQKVKGTLLSQTLTKISPCTQQLNPKLTNKDEYFKPTKKLNCNCLNEENKSNLNLKEGSSNASTTNKINKKDKNREIIVIRCTKIIDERQVVAKDRPTFVFKVDLTVCIKNGNILHKLNTRCARKALETFDQIEKGITFIKLKYFKTKFKKVMHRAGTFAFKIPIKFQKEQKILKFVFCFIIKKGNNHGNHNVSGVMTNKMQSNSRHFVSLNRCRLQQISKPYNKAPQKKKINLYTNSNLGPGSFQSLQSIQDHHMCEAFLIGDNNTVHTNEKLMDNSFSFDQEIKINSNCGPEIKRLQIDKNIHEIITNQDNDLIMNNFTNYYTFCQQDRYEVKNIRTVLSTILEDPAEGNFELLSEKHSDETKYLSILGEQYLNKESNDTIKIKSTTVISKHYHERMLDKEGCSKNEDCVAIGNGNDLHFSTETVDSLQKIEIVRGSDQTEIIQMSKSITYIFNQKDQIESSDDGSVHDVALCDLETTVERKSSSCGAVTVKSAVLNLSDQVDLWIETTLHRNSSLFTLGESLFSLPNNAQSDNELNEKPTANDSLACISFNNDE